MSLTCRYDLPFRGKLVIMGGCFRQVSPIVRHGDRAAIVRATIKRSSIWPHVKTMKLTENMRARSLDGKFSIYQTNPK